MTQLLAAHELFKGLTKAALAALGKVAKEQHYAGGDVLVAQGEEADALYFVQTGRFRVVVGSKIVALIEAGEPVGELAFFGGGTRTATLIAMRDSVVLKLSRRDYNRVAKQYPQITQAILRVVSERLMKATARTASMEARPARVIALIEAGGSKLPEDFSDRIFLELCDVLNGSDRAQFVKENCCPAANDAEYRTWLAAQETKGGYIFIDGRGSAAWTERVCRNADKLLLAADAKAGDKGLNTREKKALRWIGHDQRVLLVAREQKATEINGTTEWIEPRKPKLHHHVALNDQKDFAKIARFISGNAVGVILAGGGALGCAHLGVIRGLQDANVPIDFIGGASAGAAMGGAIAKGLTVADTLDQVEAMFIKAKAMKKLTLPVHSLLDAATFDAELQERYGFQDIADLPINFFAVSTNLSTNGLHVHRSGPLWEAVRASGSLPTILPPFIDSDSNILVDGGVLDNVPVSVMRRLKAGPNIVVSLGDPNEEWRVLARYDALRSRGKLARDVLLRRKSDSDFPSIVEIMSRSMVVASRMASRDMLGERDILLSPPIIDGMQILDWQLGREQAGKAAQYVRKQMQQDDGLAGLKIDISTEET